MVQSRLYKILLALLVFVAFGSAQITWPIFGFTPANNGARAGGMGYAFTGIADDATAIAWNPAGLSQLYSMEASAVVRFGGGSMTFDSVDGEESIDRGSAFDLNFASFVFPLDAGDYHMAMGIAYRTLYDWNEENDFSELFGETYKINFSGGVRAISPSIGFAFNEMLSLGTTLNILTGTTEHKTESASFGNEEEEFEFSGTSLDVGFFGKFSPMFSVGATVTFPYTMNIDYTDKEFGGSGEATIEVPMSFKLGVGVRPSENFTLAFDYHASPWSSTVVTIDGTEFEDLWKDIELNSIHVGMEYIAGMMPLRLGYYTSPSVLTDYNDEQRVFNVATAGLGFILDSVILDASFEYRFGSSPWTDGYDVTVTDYRVNIGAVLHIGG